jgi:hypothetical protein
MERSMKMKFKFVDLNGEEFERSYAELTDMTGDYIEGVSTPLTDEEKVALKSFSPSITDHEGIAIDISSITDSEKKLPSAIDVTFESTHSGTNRNHFRYFSDSMKNDVQSWTVPYAKPLIKNHDSSAEPLGRVVKAEFGPSTISDERDTIFVTYRVSDQEAVAKFLDGRYNTMSIGATANHIQCSVCGKDIVKDGVVNFCGHMNGRTYEGKKAIYNARNINYKEGSVVNMPADDFAQVVRISLVNDNKKIEEPKEEQEDSVIDLNIVDSIIEESIITDENVIEDLISDTVEIQVEDIKQNEILINDLQTEIEGLKVIVETKDSDLLVLQAKVEDLEKEIVNSDKIRKQNLDLAILYKKQIKDQINLYHSLIKDEEELILDNKTVSELTTVLDGLKQKYEDKQTEVQTIPVVINPIDAIDEPKTIEEEQKLTMADFEKMILNNMFK